MPDIERKTFTSQFKAGEADGSFLAQFVTFDVMDHDGDVTTAGAFDEGKAILVSAYQHGSWMGALPVGKAVVHEQDGVAVADGQFNLSMTTGRETYESVKFSGDLQEWSYGFRVTEQGDDKAIEAWAKGHEGARPARIITKVDIYELSPVLKGAGIGTATLGIKAGMPYADEAEAALAAVNAFAERTKSLADLRRKEGRDLSEPNKERIVKLAAQLGEVKAELERLAAVTEPTDEDRKAIDAAYLRFLQLNCKFTEVR